MIKSLSAADRHERAVAFYLNEIDNVEAIRPSVSSKYSDVFVKYRGKSTWIEVKMNPTDRMANIRANFDKVWIPVSEGPVSDFISEKLNNSDQAAEWIEDLRSFVGRKEIKVPSTIGGLKDPAAVQLDVMRRFLETRLTKRIHVEKNVNLGEVITDHYILGKAEPAHYIQTGDEFLQIGDEDPFDLNLPKISGKGDFSMALSERTRKYEAKPDLKLREVCYSPFSIAPGTMKENPFTSA